jgi:hypothetical protein
MLTAEDLLLYVEHCVPGGLNTLGEPFHRKRGHGWPRVRRWQLVDPEWLDGISQMLVDVPLYWWHVRSHLLGRMHVGTPWPDLVDRIEFDLDAKTAERSTIRSLVDREMRIREMLGGTPGLRWRSGPSAGWRVTYFLTEADPDLRRRLREHVDRWGLKLCDGVIECWPLKATSNRLPLGGGSDLIDQYGDPLTGRLEYVERADRSYWALRRDVPGSIRGWVEQMVAHTYALDDLLRPVPTRAGGRIRDTQEVCAPTPPSQPRLRAGALVLPSLEAGQRDDLFGRVVASLYARGYPDADIVQVVDDWLARDDHTSRDLTGPQGPTVRSAMLASLPGKLARLRQRTAAGQFQLGGRSPPRSITSLGISYAPPTLGHVVGSCTGDDPAKWKQAALALCPAVYRARVAVIEDVALRRQLLRFGAVLAQTLVEHGTELVIVVEDLRRYIVGSHKRSHRDVLEAAQHLGMLGPVQRLHNRRLHRSATYRIPWPLLPIGDQQPATASEVATQRRRAR